MIGRADIEGSKSNFAMNVWLAQASYPCLGFSRTLKIVGRLSTSLALLPNLNQDPMAFMFMLNALAYTMQTKVK
ncbi:MAG: hypothetical protein J3R72DRAFT_393390 [Linnemannia gamsii]|nr:MAG: hypothetical protein J3R72DRAFT_393390 [Linnemannia gamsii]